MAYLGDEDTPTVGSPLAEHDGYLLWLRGDKAMGHDVDGYIASAEFERARTVWLTNPNNDENEGPEEAAARIKAEIATALADGRDPEVTG